MHQLEYVDLVEIAESDILTLLIIHLVFFFYKGSLNQNMLGVITQILCTYW